MIKLHKFGPAFGLPDASPFVTKVETYLRMTGQPYETMSADVRKAPRKQLPFVDIDGTVIPDSTKIVDFLEQKRAEKMDAHLGPKERAVALAFKTMLEEFFYFGLLFMRWSTEEGWAVFEPTLRDMLGRMGVPGLMRGMVSKKARKQVTGRAQTQGLGRKPREEVVATCIQMIDALSDFLGDSPFLMGEKPTTYDATSYAFVAGVLCPAFDNELRKHASGKKNLVAYEQRMKSAYWKE